MVWSTIENNPNYEISNEGEVRHKYSKEIIKHIRTRRGPHRVTLLKYSFRCSERITYYVHDLMADAFFGGDEDSREVLYKDKNYDNLNANNLIVRLKPRTEIYAHEVDRLFKSRKDCYCYMSINSSILSNCLRTGRPYKGVHYTEHSYPAMELEAIPFINWDELEDGGEEFEEFDDED